MALYKTFVVMYSNTALCIGIVTVTYIYIKICMTFYKISHKVGLHLDFDHNDIVFNGLLIV